MNTNEYSCNNNTVAGRFFNVIFKEVFFFLKWCIDDDDDVLTVYWEMCTLFLDEFLINCDVIQKRYYYR